MLDKMACVAALGAHAETSCSRHVCVCVCVCAGTHAEMFASILRLAALPPHTLIYCAHEYTASNARFALSLEPSNPALQARVKQATLLFCVCAFFPRLTHSLAPHTLDNHSHTDTKPVSAPALPPPDSKLSYTRASSKRIKQEGQVFRRMPPLNLDL